jgi:hypothetical protein
LNCQWWNELPYFRCQLPLWTDKYINCQRRKALNQTGCKICKKKTQLKVILGFWNVLKHNHWSSTLVHNPLIIWQIEGDGLRTFHILQEQSSFSSSWSCWLRIRNWHIISFAVDRQFLTLSLPSLSRKGDGNTKDLSRMG